jgi:nitroreductase
MKFLDNYKIDYSERDAGKEVDKLFINRWSPRSFKKEELSLEIIENVIDAARWSQSAFNAQPWRFLTSTPETFDKFLNLLVDQNQMWAKNASVLGFIIAQKNFEHNNKPNKWANFDSGAAWMALTLQARKFGLYTHGMAGIKKDDVYEVFGIDKEKYRVICGFALGIIDQPEKLDEPVQSMEKPSARKALNEIWKVGKWNE